jgi:3-phenylpropionate/trans-cinnamate dioxygenase ferredoxin reductase subunit
VVLVGGGQASYATARALRENGFRGPVLILADEPHPPYERPPLSKAILTGKATPESAYFATAAQLTELGIELREDAVVAIDRTARRVTTESGAEVAYDRLLIATGGRPRTIALPGAAPPRVRYLRNLADAAALRELLSRPAPLMVLGGGWIGLEIAASARSHGASVTLLETAPRLCLRSLSEEPAAFLLDLHRRHGVRVELGAQIADVEVREDEVAVRLADGGLISAGAIVAGVGMQPNVELAAAAGLAVGIGVLVDAAGRTSDAHIWAAGDVAEVAGGPRRLESWANANEQGSAAALAMLGKPPAAPAIPWFWSDQYEVNLQILGDPDGADACIRLGDSATDNQTWCYLQADRLAAVVAANRPRDVQAGRRIMQRGIPLDPADLRRPGADLAGLLMAAQGLSR